MSKPLATLRSLDKYYELPAGRAWILRQLDLEIPEGDFLTIMGPSGAGKSSLLAILGMLDHSWSGEYSFLGNEVHKLKPAQRIELNRKNIGFIFQQYHLLDDLTVAENLELPLSYRSTKKAEREALVAEMLDRFQMVGKKDLYPAQLSGGQQQIVGVARAVIGKPALILADEPTGSLHSSQGKLIMELLQQLHAEGTTIVHVTHNDTFARYGNRIIQLQDGRIVS